MKYILIVCVFVVGISLSWCAKNNGNVDDAIKVYTAIGDTLFSSSVMEAVRQDHFNTTGIVRESFWLYSKTSTEDLLSDIHLGVVTDTIENNSQSSLSISWTIQDKTNGDELSATWVVYYIMSGDRQYINLSTGHVWLWKGNAEWLLVQMILNNIIGQRMLLDDDWFINTDKFSFPQRENIWIIIDKTQKLAQTSWLVDFDYNSMSRNYTMRLSDTWLLKEYILSLYHMLDLGYSQDPKFIFQWYIQTNPSPRLIIENLEDVYADRVLTWSLWVRNGSLSLFEQTNNWTIKREEKKTSMQISISHDTLGENIYEVSLWLIPTSIDGMLLGISYNGSIKTNILNLDGQHTNISLPIAGLYTIHIVDSTQFAEPTRYLLMSQVFGDEYGIWKLLEDQ